MGWGWKINLVKEPMMSAEAYRFRGRLRCQFREIESILFQMKIFFFWKKKICLRNDNDELIIHQTAEWQPSHSNTPFNFFLPQKDGRPVPGCRLFYSNHFLSFPGQKKVVHHRFLTSQQKVWIVFLSLRFIEGVDALVAYLKTNQKISFTIVFRGLGQKGLVIEHWCDSISECWHRCLAPLWAAATCLTTSLSVPYWFLF